jgi:hypothetical protein
MSVKELIGINAEEVQKECDAILADAEALVDSEVLVDESMKIVNKRSFLERLLGL